MPQADDDSHRSRVLALLKRHGWNATSFQVLEPGFRYWFDGDDACVAFVDTGGCWVAAGVPICQPDAFARTADRFAEAAKEAGRRVCFFGPERRFASSVDLAHLQIGEQPVWNPRDWDETLRSSRSLREQLRRAKAKGVQVRRVPANELASRDASPVRPAVEGLIERWLRTRAMAPMGFLVQVDPFEFAEERRYYVAERDGVLVGFLAAVPVYARNGWFVEDLLRDPSAPNGTAELLVDAAMRGAAEEGSTYLTLGLAPLAGDGQRWLALARTWGAELYDFEGVRAFKARLRPGAWDPILLSYPRGESGLRAIYDTLAAFARGGLLRFGIRSLLRGPSVVVRLLGLLLIPWALLIALPTSTPHFPSPWLQWAWVSFDGVLAGLLLSLSANWRPRLATLVASLASADAVLTLAQALAWNLPRIESAMDAALVAIGCVAPIGASAILWRARAHRLKQLEDRQRPAGPAA